MPRVVAYADIANPRTHYRLMDGRDNWRTHFMQLPADKSRDSPMAFIGEIGPGGVIPPHFHEVDQFQVICIGDGRLGTHQLGFGAVHFARAYTPYGPIHCGDRGLGFMTLRAHRDSGAQYMPERRPMLDRVPNRNPWQITDEPDFTIQPDHTGVAIKAMPHLRDERGLAGYTVVLKPGAQILAPDPSDSDGQCILITAGCIVHQGEQKNSLALVWVGNDEAPFRLEAGPQGCTGIVLNYPRAAVMPAAARAPAANDLEGFKTWQCALCGFVYDEAAGLPEYNIKPETRWADVPDQFACPECDSRKADFEMMAI